MNIVNFKPSQLRLILAGLTAVAGGIVSVAMTIWGGPMSSFLPTNEGFHLAAIVGAGLAGFICAGGIGRGGKRGWLIAALVSCVATGLGAVLGATMLGAFFGSFHGAPLGVIAILDASESVVALIIWVVTMAALHLAARTLRARQGAVSP